MTVALEVFRDDVNSRFPGTHELSVSTRDKAESAEWFGRMLEVFPSLRLDVQGIAVTGTPWNTHATTRFIATYSMPDGENLALPAMQHLHIAWGKVKSDQARARLRPTICPRWRRAPVD